MRAARSGPKHAISCVDERLQRTRFSLNSSAFALAVQRVLYERARIFTLALAPRNIVFLPDLGKFWLSSAPRRLSLDSEIQEMLSFSYNALPPRRQGRHALFSRTRI
ncbi:hypothetical protein PUNSTDRAFT_52216 [Punctularia strigosozonata HHB-11173 SS5]|uniref:uncharacterized protein n=1 Tax=Punctularia strigosozonata (strain HHB-11173) TaxID=741275 RepID=UPI000441707C|nr:uncharacterized protein PUNSTDRAFT_52216 [Punctularia strigosozonata HHB-11173 SS5]EIN08730.1 hypothetical protein PUNSTDRAFT_52216 [Punctularia strigosozonata HHB-11173 SS5]